MFLQISQTTILLVLEHTLGHKAPEEDRWWLGAGRHRGRAPWLTALTIFTTLRVARLQGFSLPKAGSVSVTGQEGRYGTPPRIPGFYPSSRVTSTHSPSSGAGIPEAPGAGAE